MASTCALARSQSDFVGNPFIWIPFSILLAWDAAWLHSDDPAPWRVGVKEYCAATATGHNDSHKAKSNRGNAFIVKRHLRTLLVGLLIGLYKKSVRVCAAARSAR